MRISWCSPMKLYITGDVISLATTLVRCQRDIYTNIFILGNWVFICNSGVYVHDKHFALGGFISRRCSSYNSNNNRHYNYLKLEYVYIKL